MYIGPIYFEGIDIQPTTTGTTTPTTTATDTNYNHHKFSFTLITSMRSTHVPLGYNYINNVIGIGDKEYY